ncbi:uncharacterized protein N7482_008144 [Penicillium canariense]|uniref:Uncharacterized protein n=1 Tax=Penicillium canariense TaxID=189055 RepID=A0A9W9HV70_9EURO|nr:uncharacterized protein N7482_008144 [Penicillium canariense]KAJ5157044.1 hypothetical protein N7482_008144 [Penicillium canariense]
MISQSPASLTFISAHSTKQKPSVHAAGGDKASQPTAGLTDDGMAGVGAAGGININIDIKIKLNSPLSQSSNPSS